MGDTPTAPAAMIDTANLSRCAHLRAMDAHCKALCELEKGTLFLVATGNFSRHTARSAREWETSNAWRAYAIATAQRDGVPF